MPIKKNSLSEVGPATGQLKRTFSSLERTQINAMSGMSGSVSSRAGGLSGDTSKHLRGLNNTSQGRMAIGANMAAALEATGVTTQNSRNFLANTVSPSVNQKRGLHKSIASSPIDLSDPGNRMPSLRGRNPNEIMENKQRRINGSPNLAFPFDVSDAPGYVMLEFHSYDRETAFAPGSLSRVDDIKLPLPDNFAQTYSMSYEPRDAGFMHDEGARALESMAKDLVQGTAGWGDIKRDDVLKALGGLTGSIGARKTWAALDLINDIMPAKDIAGSVAGMIPNPHTSIFFQGMDLRSFQWNWKLVPRNSGEAETIEGILKKIKNHVLPKAEGITLSYPDMLWPKIGGEIANAYGEFRICMVQNLTINFSAEGASAFFRDGRPVAIQLGLEFKEVDLAVSGG